MEWSGQEAEVLAKDPAVVKAGRELANAARWNSLGGMLSLAWGQCQGSGKSAYQVVVDRSEPAYRCSCPSRKFPCKHVIALIILRSETASLFGNPSQPPWVGSWLEARSKRQSKTIDNEASLAEVQVDDSVVDKKTKDKERRQERRSSKVSAGLDDLSVWLADVVRGGLADASSKLGPMALEQASRLIDAQAPGVGAGSESWRKRSRQQSNERQSPRLINLLDFIY